MDEIEILLNDSELEATYKNFIKLIKDTKYKEKITEVVIQRYLETAFDLEVKNGTRKIAENESATDFSLLVEGQEWLFEETTISYFDGDIFSAIKDGIERKIDKINKKESYVNLVLTNYKTLNQTLEYEKRWLEDLEKNNLDVKNIEFAFEQVDNDATNLMSVFSINPYLRNNTTYIKNLSFIKSKSNLSDEDKIILLPLSIWSTWIKDTLTPMRMMLLIIFRKGKTQPEFKTTTHTYEDWKRYLREQREKDSNSQNSINEIKELFK